MNINSLLDAGFVENRSEDGILGKEKSLFVLYAYLKKMLKRYY